jgi:protein ImuB
VVLSGNTQARSHGIAAGMKVSAAIALAPDLVERRRDATGERHALERIAGWSGQFSSMVSLSPPDALLGVGSLRLFSGLRQMCCGSRRLNSRLCRSAAVAPTDRRPPVARGLHPPPIAGSNPLSQPAARAAN